MEIKVLINSLLIILIIYIILDNIPYRYRFGIERNIINNRQSREKYEVSENFDNSFKSNNQSLDFLNNDDIDSKKELYDYLLSDNQENNNTSESNIKPGNYWLTNDNIPNYGSNVMDISKNYNIENNYEGLEANNLKENNYSDQNQERKIMEQTMIDKETKQASFLDNNTNDNQNTFKPDNWQYKNELPMNGGMFNGISGFDSLNSSFAVYDKNTLNLEKCDDYLKCKPTDDLRNGMSIKANEARLNDL